MSLLVPITGIQLALRASSAAGLSLAIAQFFNLEYPISAAIAAIVVTDLSPSETTILGRRRLVAMVIGAACGAVLGMVLPSGPWAIGVSILVAMLACHLFRVSEGAKVAGYICAIVMLSHGAGGPWHDPFNRLIETGLGIGVAWLISCVPKLIQTDAKDQP